MFYGTPSWKDRACLEIKVEIYDGIAIASDAFVLNVTNAVKKKKKIKKKKIK